MLLLSFESYFIKVIFLSFSLNFHPCILKLQRLKQFAIFFLTSPLTSMEKWHFQNFVKVETVVFEKCKDETLSKLYSTCIYYLALQLLQSNCYLILISHNREILVNNENVKIILWNYFLSLTVLLKLNTTQGYWSTERKE